MRTFSPALLANFICTTQCYQLPSPRFTSAPQTYSPYSWKCISLFLSIAHTPPWPCQLLFYSIWLFFKKKGLHIYVIPCSISLTYFTRQNACQAHPCYHKRQDFLLCQGWIIPQYIKSFAFDLGTPLLPSTLNLSLQNNISFVENMNLQHPGQLALLSWVKEVSQAKPT